MVKYKTRTCDPLIKSQLTEKHKAYEINELYESESTTVVPAYKKCREKGCNCTPVVPPDLAKVIEAWPELPSAIRSAIVAIVRASRGQE